MFKKAFSSRYLIWTNVLSSGVLFGIGDTIEQKIEMSQKRTLKHYDFDRVRKMFLVGLVQGLASHYFYKHLDIYLPKSDGKTITKKIFIDQLIGSPIFIIIFFFGLGFMEHKRIYEMTQELESKFLATYTVSKNPSITNRKSSNKYSKTHLDRF